MSQEITLNHLYESKKYKTKSGITYPSYKDYVEPFLKTIDPLLDELQITVDKEIVNTNEDGTENIAYGRLLVKGLLKSDYNLEKELGSEIGMLIAMDTQKPLIKVYSGKQVFACTNLCVFNSKHIFSQDLLGDTENVYKRVKIYAEEVEEELTYFAEKIKQLKDTHYDGEQLHRLIGNLIRHSIINPRIGQTPIIHGTKELFNPKSKYAMTDGGTTAWNYYNSITDALKKEDLIKIPDKSMLLSNVFFKDIAGDN